MQARRCALRSSAASQSVRAPLLARHADLHRKGDQPHWDLEEDGDGRSTPSAQRLQTILEPGWFDPALLDFLNLESTNRAAADITGCDDPAQLSAAGLAIRPPMRKRPAAASSPPARSHSQHPPCPSS